MFYFLYPSHFSFLKLTLFCDHFLFLLFVAGTVLIFLKLLYFIFIFRWSPRKLYYF